MFRFLVVCIFINLILPHVRTQDLFALNSNTPTWNAWDASDALDDPVHDAGFLSANSVLQDNDMLSDPIWLENSDNLFSSNAWDLSARPSCDTTGSLTDDDMLQSRDLGSCNNNHENEKFNLPTDLFENPEDVLRGIVIPAEPEIQYDPETDQPGQYAQRYEQKLQAKLTEDLKPNDGVCPPEVYGPFNIPVCSNPFTGHASQDPATFLWHLLNVIPCMFPQSGLCASLNLFLGWIIIDAIG